MSFASPPCGTLEVLMANPLKHAMCNEAFESTPFAEQCRIMKSAGYEGIEIAPFTLAADPVDITALQRKEYARIIADEGLKFVGLHWLMVSPKGLHVTTPDQALRERSWKHIRNLIDLCADLGENGVMVFGSPNQRSTTVGLTRAEATRNYVEGLASIAPQAEERGVTVLVEALPIAQSDVVQNLEEAVAIVREINSPGVRRDSSGVGGTLFRIHPPRARQRTRRTALRNGELRFWRAVRSADPAWLSALGIARSVRF